MKPSKKLLNKLVNVAVYNKIGHLTTLSGYLTTISKDYFIILDQDGHEHIFKRSQINEIKQINSVRTILHPVA